MLFELFSLSHDMLANCYVTGKALQGYINAAFHETTVGYGKKSMSTYHMTYRKYFCGHKFHKLMTCFLELLPQKVNWGGY